MNDRMRKLIFNSDDVQGSVVNHRVNGGTRSGLGALIWERMAVDHRKKLGFECYPSATNNNCVVEPYNILLFVFFCFFFWRWNECWFEWISNKFSTISKVKFYDNINGRYQY